jgi:MFS transporter, OFA family, oxalate/formate antiporter
MLTSKKNMAQAANKSEASALPKARWGQLICSIMCLVLIANLQYGWTLFVNPINKMHGWSIAAIQLAFSIFIALETWLTPIEGWIVDSLGAQRGPKLMAAFGGITIAAGWLLDSFAQSLSALYFGAAFAGIGAGAVWATCVGLSAKWFPDRRGLALGLTVAGYGAGSALTVVPIRQVIASGGYEAAFFWFGLIQGGIIFLLAWLLRGPEEAEISGFSGSQVLQTGRSYSPVQMLGTPVFWLLYIMFIIISASGLMVAAELAPIAKDFNIADVFVFLGATTLSATLIIDNIANGAARPLFGWASDYLGREQTMAIAFGLGGISYWLLGTLGQAPWAFVLFAALIFLTWGEIFSLFPSTCTDTFGAKFATVNLCLLYTAKGASAFLVPVANIMKGWAGDWHAVFVVTAIMNYVVVVLALFVLKPLRYRLLNQSLGRP